MLFLPGKVRACKLGESGIPFITAVWRSSAANQLSADGIPTVQALLALAVVVLAVGRWRQLLAALARVPLPDMLAAVLAVAALIRRHPRALPSRALPAVASLGVITFGQTANLASYHAVCHLDFLWLRLSC